MKRKLTLLISTTFIVISSMFAQTIPVNSLSLGEFDPYISQYFKPMASGIAVSMGSGWVHTAEVHSTLGVDITFSGAFVTIPESDASFSVDALSDMTDVGYTFTGTTYPNIRTSSDVAAGDINKDFTPIEFEGLSYTPSVNMAALTGLSAKYAGTMSLQLGVGLPKGTDLMVRYFPDVSSMVNAGLEGLDMEMSKTSYWGVGLKHDIKQWIPVLEKVPFLQMSAMFTYSSFNTGFSGDLMTFGPDDFGDVYTELPETTWDDQEFTLKVSSFTGALLVGASIPVFQPFIGIGFNSGGFDAGLDGTYPIIKTNADYNPTAAAGDRNSYLLVTDDEDIETDPLSIEDNVTEFNFQAGARLKLGFFVLHYQYTRQKYNMHSGGIAITFR